MHSFFRFLFLGSILELFRLLKVDLFPFLGSICVLFRFLKGNVFSFFLFVVPSLSFLDFYISKGRFLVFQKLMSQQSTCYRDHGGNNPPHCHPESRPLEADNPSLSRCHPPSAQTLQPAAEESAVEVCGRPLSVLPGTPCLPI